MFISRWREEGPASSEVLESWKDELAWPSWLTLAEAALFMDAPELLEALDVHLSEGERAVLGLVRRRWLGDTHLGSAIEEALSVVARRRPGIWLSRADFAWNGVCCVLKRAMQRPRKI